MLEYLLLILVICDVFFSSIEYSGSTLVVLRVLYVTDKCSTTVISS